MGLPQRNEVSSPKYVTLIIMIAGSSSFKFCFTDAVGGGFYVDLSLSIVMPSARNAWGSHLGPYYSWKPPQTFHFLEPELWLDQTLWWFLS